MAHDPAAALPAPPKARRPARELTQVDPRARSLGELYACYCLDLLVADDEAKLDRRLLADLEARDLPAALRVTLADNDIWFALSESAGFRVESFEVLVRPRQPVSNAS